MVYELLDGFSARLEKVLFRPELEAPPDRPYPFAYFIALENQSEVEIQVKGRKWVVRDEDGYVRIVEGNGVVGECPVLEPGDVFSYNSYMTISADSVVSGSFFATACDGRHVMTQLPPFRLTVP